MKRPDHDVQGAAGWDLYFPSETSWSVGLHFVKERRRIERQVSFTTCVQQVNFGMQRDVVHQTGDGRRSAVVSWGRDRSACARPCPPPVDPSCDGRCNKMVDSPGSVPMQWPAFSLCLTRLERATSRARTAASLRAMIFVPQRGAHCGPGSADPFRLTSTACSKSNLSRWK